MDEDEEDLSNQLGFRVFVGAIYANYRVWSDASGEIIEIETKLRFVFGWKWTQE